MLAVLAAVFAVPGTQAAPRDIITRMKGQQATQWRRTVIDLNLVGEYYADPANAPLWVKNGKPTQAAKDLYDALGAAAADVAVLPADPDS